MHPRHATRLGHGAELQRGIATLRATDLAIPVGGISLARVTTARDERFKKRGSHESITVRIERQPDKMLAEVEIPALIARLPPSVTRSVIDVADNPNISVAQPLRRPEAPRSGASGGQVCNCASEVRTEN